MQTATVLTRQREQARCPTSLILSGRGDPQGLLPAGIAAARSATLGFDVDVLPATQPCKPEGVAIPASLPGSHPPSGSSRFLPSTLLSHAAIHLFFN